MEQSAVLEQLARQLESRVPGLAFERRVSATAPEIAVASPSTQVGELTVADDGEELTVSIGTFTHSHWHHPGSAAASDLRQDVAGFILAVLTDQIEFYGTGTAGGSKPVGKPRSWLSKLVFGPATYRWSGPVNG